jgi:hypothetical protein
MSFLCLTVSNRLAPLRDSQWYPSVRVHAQASSPPPHQDQVLRLREVVQQTALGRNFCDGVKPLVRVQLSQMHKNEAMSPLASFAELSIEESCLNCVFVSICMRRSVPHHQPAKLAPVPRSGVGPWHPRRSAAHFPCAHNFWRLRMRGCMVLVNQLGPVRSLARTFGTFHLAVDCL